MNNRTINRNAVGKIASEVRKYQAGLGSRVSYYSVVDGDWEVFSWTTLAAAKDFWRRLEHAQSATYGDFGLTIRAVPGGRGTVSVCYRQEENRTGGQ